MLRQQLLADLVVGALFLVGLAVGVSVGTLLVLLVVVAGPVTTVVVMRGHRIYGGPVRPLDRTRPAEWEPERTRRTR